MKHMITVLAGGALLLPAGLFDSAAYASPQEPMCESASVSKGGDKVAAADKPDKAAKTAGAEKAPAEPKEMAMAMGCGGPEVTPPEPPEPREPHVPPERPDPPEPALPSGGQRGDVLAEERGTNPMAPTWRYVVRCRGGRVGHGPNMGNQAEALDQAFADCSD